MIIHRIGKVGRHHSRSSAPASLLKQGYPRAHGTELHPEGSRISLVREAPQRLWAPCSSVWSLHCKEFLPHIGRNFLCITFCLLSYCWVPWSRAWSFLLTPSPQILINIDEIPSQLVLLEQPHLPQLFFIAEMLQSLHHLCPPLLDPLQELHLSLALRSSEMDTTLQIHLTRVE